MELKLTIEEAINRGLWKKICDIKGFDFYGVNNGYYHPDFIITLKESEMQKIDIDLTIKD